jgi:hypothetical protein
MAGSDQFALHAPVVVYLSRQQSHPGVGELGTPKQSTLNIDWWQGASRWAVEVFGGILGRVLLLHDKGQRGYDHDIIDRTVECVHCYAESGPSGTHGALQEHHRELQHRGTG